MWQNSLTETQKKEHFARRRAETLFYAALHRDREAVLLKDDSYQRNMSKRFHFGLELREQDQPAKMVTNLPDAREGIRNSIPSKIGADPTPMIRMVLKGVH